MQGLIERIGIPLLVQIVIESWNGLFLLVMVVSMAFGGQLKQTDGTGKIEVPFTKEIITFDIAVLLYNFFNVTGILTDMGTTLLSYWLVRISDFLYYLVGAFLTLFFLQLIKKHVAEKNGLQRLKGTVFFLQLMHIPQLLLLAVTPFTGALYEITAENSYVRGPLFFIWHAWTIVIFMFILTVYFIYRNRIERFPRRVIFTAVTVPIFGFLLNTNYIGISFNNISVSIAALLIFVFYEQHRTAVAVQQSHALDLAQTQLAEKQLALVRSKNEVLMAQIQPHFINNSLMALRSRCREYPDLYESITNFSRYLRSHFDALSDTKMITFEQEMENIEAYLELERVNYEGRLHVEYDIEFDDFLVPALSVQPLVENAVRHGIGTYEKGGTVWIRVHRTEGRICIEIIDDGSGKSSMTERQEKRKGIGIENVRARLESLQNAELEIQIGDHGSTVRILIDDRGEAEW